MNLIVYDIHLKHVRKERKMMSSMGVCGPVLAQWKSFREPTLILQDLDNHRGIDECRVLYLQLLKLIGVMRYSERPFFIS